ncbi:hypothetical protein K8S19_13255 [bacterium]|nr:hypothetical protein [bacterium]
MGFLPRRWRLFFKEKIFNNWRYKLAALAAAFIIWSYVAGQQSMQSVYTVPVYFNNLSVGRAVAEPKEQKIQVTISGRRDRILSLKERQIWVSINLSALRVGKSIYTLSKQDIIVPSGIEVKTFSPASVKIRIIRSRKKSVK